MLANIIWYEIIYYVSSSYDNKIFIIYPISEIMIIFFALLLFIIY